MPTIRIKVLQTGFRSPARSPVSQDDTDHSVSSKLVGMPLKTAVVCYASYCTVQRFAFLKIGVDLL